MPCPAQVRALLLLGMLVGRAPDAQVELAGTPGTVTTLLALMRYSQDEDAKQLARELFSLIVRNGDARACAEAELRADS